MFKFSRLPGSPPPTPRWWSGLVSQCALCRSWPAEPVCQLCLARFNPEQRRCRHCALILPADLSGGSRALPTLCLPCQRHPPPLTQTLAAVSYAFPWSGLIGQYKFANHPGWAPFLARLMLQNSAVTRCLADLEPEDWVLPLPLSAQRLQTRGFNQSWLLARNLAHHTVARPDAQLLLRIRDTRPQSQLLREERLTNVKGAFMVDPLRANQIVGRHVVLVDDVMTSGASLYAAARALNNAGAAQVSALVLARTEP